MSHEYPSYTTLIANPSFILFVHVHKIYQNTLTTWALRAEVEKGTRREKLGSFQPF